MLHRSRSRDYGPSPGPTNFTKQQMGDYLQDLRNNRPAKPSGGRPLPAVPKASTRRSMHFDQPSLRCSSSSSESSQGHGHSRSSSAMSFYRGGGSMSGRSSPEKIMFNTVRDQNSRRAEREESHAVRVAMDAMHMRETDHMPDDARAEALELLRQHQYPNAPYRAPQQSPTKTSPRKSVPQDPADIEYGLDGTKYRNGMEVRGDDMKAATSRSLRERSPNLPSPAFVSDAPDRPIVSFRKDWRPPEPKQDNYNSAYAPASRPQPSPAQRNPSPFNKSVTAPAVPTLHDMDAARAVDSGRDQPAPPTISINDESEPPSIPEINVQDIPVISVEEDSTPVRRTPCIATPSIYEPDTPASTAVTPTPKPRPGRQAAARSARPPARHAATAPIPASPSKRTPHSMRGGSTLCAQCALPIYGRTVSAAGTRFHPECFVCYNCGEGLECVQFYPEPAASRDARLERMDRRMTGEDVEPPSGHSMADDNDDSLRFYCHLDYHEFFSPRCKNCKTPIEGEMIAALGAQYHPGHFFCANCGDPFDQQTPFVEKDGYAWCVNCHHNRTSGKCKKCRRPITDMVLKALDAEWHEDCFRCMECSGNFDDGRYFLRGESMDPVCSKCEARRLKL